MAKARPGDVWLVDLGLAAKTRPCLVLSEYPADDELVLIVVVPHTTAVRNNRWELSVPKPFLKAGVFHLQQIQSIPLVRLQRKLGELTAPGTDWIPIHIGPFTQPESCRIASASVNRKAMRHSWRVGSGVVRARRVRHNVDW